MISIYSPKTEPFGTLSNNARLPFTINDVSWLTVSEYVYANLLPYPEWISNMRKIAIDGAYDNPYGTAREELWKLERNVMKRSIEKSLKARIVGDEELARRYRAHGNDVIFVVKTGTAASGMFPTTNIAVDALNSMRGEYFYDLRRGLIDRKELTRTINRVERQLIRDPNYITSANADYDFLTKLHKAVGGDDDADQSDVIARLDNNVDQIVPVLKRKFKLELYYRAIQRFKDELLSVYLDHILSVYYPEVPIDKYGLAKAQQMGREATVDRYKDSLYNAYLRDQLNDEVVSRMREPPPDVVIVSRDDYFRKLKEEDDELRRARDPVTAANVVELDGDDPLLAWHVADFTLDGATWSSPVAYAYTATLNYVTGGESNGYAARLHANSGYATEKDLEWKYYELLAEYIFKTVAENCRVALVEKFYEYESLQTLLYFTLLNTEIVWQDRNDPVLGTGTIPLSKDMENVELFRRNNLLGVMLMDYRMRTNVADLSDQRVVDKFRYVSDSGVYRVWLYKRVNDFVNTMSMMKSISIRDVLRVYYNDAQFVVPLSDLKPLNAQDVAIIRDAGVKRKDAFDSVIWPLISYEYRVNYEGDKREIDSIYRYVKTFDLTPPSPETIARAESVLSGAYDDMAGELNVDREEFVGRVLSGTKILYDRPNWRTNYWAGLMRL